MKTKHIKEHWLDSANKFKGKKWHYWSGRLANAVSSTLHSSVEDLSSHLKFLEWVLNEYNSAVEQETK